MISMDFEASKINSENKWKNGSFNQMVNDSHIEVNANLKWIANVEVDWS